ncbi:MAG TPA: hypothetical protein PLA71_00320 [Saccharofermentans sp.]|nr:hypothetical protein [Saccharofermentans sp.]
MDLHLEAVLVNEFPILYSGASLPMDESLMCFGFECGNGWFKIIYDLSKKLEQYNSTHPDSPVVAMQVKEKYGALRFYAMGGCDATFDLIEEACKLTETICEECGKPGGANSNGWISTLCPYHREKFKIDHFVGSLWSTLRFIEKLKKDMENDELPSEKKAITIKQLSYHKNNVSSITKNLKKALKEASF